ncbi:hypothetical protein [Demequina litorisediminis]|uniref:hypothetical protein n=1 Tax=Demequina litorisediminis TaxID=1849022 RepID=UPI0024E07CC1|nr:hypothetical protein [Demequina litorisediminis]
MGHVITLADFDTYPDFPVEGILFYDISPILADPVRFKEACDALTPDAEIDVVVGVDARGFIFAPVVAQAMGIGMSMVRKKGKMPGELLEADATIEYGASEARGEPQRPRGQAGPRDRRRAGHGRHRACGRRHAGACGRGERALRVPHGDRWPARPRTPRRVRRRVRGDGRLGRQPNRARR